MPSRLCGSYEAMEGGFTTDALIDMTGGIEEAFELNNAATAGSKEFQDQIKAVSSAGVLSSIDDRLFDHGTTSNPRGEKVDFPHRFRLIRKSPKRVCRTVWSKVRSIFFVLVELRASSSGHAYSITRVATVTTDAGPLTLIRCLSEFFLLHLSSRSTLFLQIRGATRPNGESSEFFRTFREFFV